MIDAKGYELAVAHVMRMSDRELFQYLDRLEGRENLPRSCTLEVIREEALLQTERKFTNMTAEDLEREQKDKKVAFAATLVPGRGKPRS